MVIRVFRVIRDFPDNPAIQVLVVLESAVTQDSQGLAQAGLVGLVATQDFQDIPDSQVTRDFLVSLVFLVTHPVIRGSPDIRATTPARRVIQVTQVSPGIQGSVDRVSVGTLAFLDQVSVVTRGFPDGRATQVSRVKVATQDFLVVLVTLVSVDIQDDQVIPAISREPAGTQDFLEDQAIRDLAGLLRGSGNQVIQDTVDIRVLVGIQASLGIPDLQEFQDILDFPAHYSQSFKLLALMKPQP